MRKKKTKTTGPSSSHLIISFFFCLQVGQVGLGRGQTCGGEEDSTRGRERVPAVGTRVERERSRAGTDGRGVGTPGKGGTN